MFCVEHWIVPRRTIFRDAISGGGCQVNLLQVECLEVTQVAVNYGLLCIAATLRTITDFISHFGYCWSMSKTNSEERKARDAAFAELLDSLNPGSALRRQMIAARVRTGLSQQELAKRMGTAQSTIARLERGGRSPNISTLRKFAEATGSRLVMRLDATEPEFPPPANQCPILNTEVIVESTSTGSPRYHSTIPTQPHLGAARRLGEPSPAPENPVPLDRSMV